MSLPSLADFPAILLPLITRARQTWRTALTELSADALASFEAWP
ncbi:bifunctional glutamine-synthetase adenylyltransferase/deadenyltransferase, partial [Pseudomonas syringae pv. actinidiae ICMP 18804]